MQDDVAIDPYLAPVSDLIEETETSSLLIFKRFSTWFVFLLNLLSFGIYSYFWLFLRTKKINTYTQNKIPEIIIYSDIGLYFGSIGLDIVSAFTYIPENILEINNWSMLPVFILHTIWLFSFRSRLSDLLSVRSAIGLHVSGIMTFFFGTVYLQYKINEGLDVLNEEFVVYKEQPDRKTILDSDLVVDGMDFSNYTRVELQDCLMNIDKEKYADRVRVIRMALGRYK